MAILDRLARLLIWLAERLLGRSVWVEPLPPRSERAPLVPSDEPPVYETAIQYGPPTGMQEIAPGVYTRELTAEEVNAMSYTEWPPERKPKP